MKIAYFTNTYPRATDTFIRREVLALRARGFDVRTFSVWRSDRTHDVSADVVAEKRSTVYLLPTGFARVIWANLRAVIRRPGCYVAALGVTLKTRMPGARGLVYQLIYFQEAVLLASAMEREGISHLHNHLGDNSGTVAMLASRLTKIPYSITIHGPHIFFDPTHWALREKVASSSFIACISHFCQSQMMLYSDFSHWNRLKIVHCGVDLACYEVTPVRPVARKILYAGRLAVEKGLPILFESLRDLSESGYDFGLTLLGDGPDRAPLEALGSSLGIRDRLDFVGYVGEDVVRRHLSESDIFVLPSFAEGVPVSLMEAMACGVPVLATYVGGVVELIEHGRTGLLVPPADPVSLKDAIARYLEDFDLRREVARQARVWIESRFNLSTEVDKLAALFQGA